MIARTKRRRAFVDGLVPGLVSCVVAALVHHTDRLESMVVLGGTTAVTYGLLTVLSDLLLARTHLLDPAGAMTAERIRRESLASVGLLSLGPATGLLSLTDRHVVYRSAKPRSPQTVDIPLADIEQVDARRLLGSPLAVMLSLRSGRRLTFRIPDAPAWVEQLRREVTLGSSRS